MQFGCILSPYDSRDYRLKAGAAKTDLPAEYSCPLKAEVKNQQQVGSCVAHATSSILEYHSIPHASLSTNFIYGIQKELFNRDTGGMVLRDACKIAADYGDMLLEDCPGNDEVPKSHNIASTAFADQNKLDKAKNYRILKYFLCLNNNDIKHALYNYGPVLGSLKWYSGFKVDKDGTLIANKTGTSGYHAVMIYGYTKDGFWCQNSWGVNWGKNGRFFVPNSTKFVEARGFVDWNGSDELREPNPNGIFNLLYKGLNAIINFISKLFSKK